MGLHGWGSIQEAELVDAVHAALDLGVRLFDTSDIYGFGTSERILGGALRGRRHQALIATKFGVRRIDGRTVHDNSPAWISEAVESSLRRLGTDYIDLYQLHYRERTTPAADIAGAMEELKRQGKIRAFGVTNCDPLEFGAGAVSFSHQYSLVQREAEKSVSDIQGRTKMAFLSWGSLGQGILSGKYGDLHALAPDDRRRRPEYENFHGARFAAVQALLPAVAEIRDRIGAGSTTQVALRWIVQRLPRAVALVGIKRAAQIEDAARMLSLRLDETSMQRLDGLALPFCDAAPIFES